MLGALVGAVCCCLTLDLEGSSGSSVRANSVILLVYVDVSIVFFCCSFVSFW